MTIEHTKQRIPTQFQRPSVHDDYLMIFGRGVTIQSFNKDYDFRMCLSLKFYTIKIRNLKHSISKPSWFRSRNQRVYHYIDFRFCITCISYISYLIPVDLYKLHVCFIRYVIHICKMILICNFHLIWLIPRLIVDDISW